MEKVSRDEVLDVVRSMGPCLPRDVVKSLGKSDTFMVGAVLSELIQANHVRVTNTKIGTSPTYYAPGQEPKLVNLSKYLNQKDKRAYDLLFEKKILRDSQLEPLVRVSLRAIKDFSKPLEINVNQKKEIFWKWYLLSNQEAIDYIKDMFGQKPKPEPVIEPRPEPKIEVNIEEPNIPEVQETQTIKKEEIKPEPIPIQIPKIIEEKIIEKQEKEPLQAVKPKEGFHFKKPEEKPKHEKSSDYKQDNEQNKLRTELENTEFLSVIHDYFKKNDIVIDKEELIKKNSEYDFIIRMPSPFGRISFFCKAKSKKKNNEQDVAAAYLSADEHRLPTIYLTTGEFTKKAQSQLEKYKSITIKQI